MKIPKLLTAAFIAATALTATASAQTKIYITGSTAFRSATVNAITATLGGTVTTASDNATLTSANAVTWTGGTIGSPAVAVTIKASWSGSAAGIQTVAGSLNAVRFLPDGATGTANADPRNTANPAEVAVPDICMADNLQTSTPFTAGSLVNGGPATYANLTSTSFQVGVVAFTWAASNGFPSGMSMTKKLAEAQLGAGAVPLGSYTGLPADTPSSDGSVTPTKIVYTTGRDPDSGTRIVTLAESGYGVNNFVVQWKPTSSGSNGSIGGMALYPVQNINGVSTTNAGNSGESSGSSLRAYLTTDLKGDTSLANCSTTNGSTTVTVTSTANLAPGMVVTGPNIVAQNTNNNIPATTISSITNGTTFVLSAAATGTGSGLTLNFTGALKNGETGPSYLITYLGVSDFNSVKSGASGITKPAVALKWNGVDYSQDAIKNGQYTFWGYEYLMYRPTLSGTKLTFATNLKDNIAGTSSATLNPNVKLTDMNVTRAGDGGPITNPNF